MPKNNQKVKRNWFFIILLTVIALALAGTAAYFSIFGLSKLFVGAGLGIIILATVLEAAKLTAVSYVYRYWKAIAKALRAYYIFGVVFIMLLTSIGIYGFLTSAYQKTANKVEIRDSQIKIAENKKSLFVAQLDRVNKTIESNNNRITQLSNVRGLQERRLDTLYNRKMYSRTKGTETSISGADAQIQFLNEDITDKMKQASVINDSISYYDQKIIEIKASDVSTEVGPLKYLSDLTGIPMNKVVNILVLLIIFVFDPMAIALLIGVNQLTMIDKEVPDEQIKIPTIFKRKKKEEEVVEETEPEPIVIEKEEIIVEEKPIEQPIEEKKEKVLPRIVYREAPDEIEEQEILEKQEEQSEPKKNESLLQDCPDGYIEEKIELDKKDITEGLRVHHNAFGKGKIIKSDIEKNRVLIHFDEIGIKELNPDYAKLSEIRCVKKEEIIEAVPYLIFSVDDPEIKDILIKKPVSVDEETQKEEQPVEILEPIKEEFIEFSPSIIEEPIVEKPIVEKPIEQIIKTQIEKTPPPAQKKTKLLPKIWHGKRLI